MNILNDRLRTEDSLAEPAELVFLLADQHHTRSPQPETHAKRRLHGHIDLATRTEIRGWVWDPHNPTERIRLELTEEDVPIATAIADIPRPGLEIAGIGDGRHEFRIRLDPDAISGCEHLLQLRCLETGALVPGSPFVVGAVATELEGPSPSTVGQLATLESTSTALTDPSHNELGYCDRVSPTSVEGWAYDPTEPDTPLIMEAFIDGEHVSAVECNRSRYDHSGNPSRAIGFQATVPARFRDGASHRIEFRRRDGSPVALRDGSGVSLFWTLPPAEVFDNAQALAGATYKPTAEIAVVDRGSLYKLFDADYYQLQVGKVEDPLQHYMLTGWKLGANPHPMFDTDYYRLLTKSDIYPDPLTHFFQVGQFRNISTHPLFSVDLYLKARPGVLQARINPVLHYLEHGWKETEFPSLFFSDHYYEGQCPGIRAMGFAPAIHYLTMGYREGRKPHSEFDPKVFSKYAGGSCKGEPLTALLRDVAQARTQPQTTQSIRVSIIILNLEKTLTTLQCLHFLRQNTDMAGVEVIVVDNGSSPDRFSLLCKYAAGCSIVRIGVNRGFGEGNNIGVETAQGEILVFLNNDTFVTPGWLAKLEAVLRSDNTIGAVGPRFLYPDGSLQEAGAMIGPDGTAVQRGKHLDPRDPLFNLQSDVDYVSAATLVMWKNLFIEVLGYDLCWDPAYYEDADLSLKLRLIGKRTVYVPTVEIIHLENATSSDQNLNLKLHNVVRANRLKFVARWGQFLSGVSDSVKSDLTNFYAPERPADKPRTVALYTPYPLTPGGGERYLLSLAAALADDFNCVLLTDEPYSRLRLLTLGRELDIDISHVMLGVWSKRHELEPFDLFICMGNEILPPVHARGKTSFHHCQFPFPMQYGHFVRDWGKLDGYKGFIVNSDFTRKHVHAQGVELSLDLPPVSVLYPPVPQLGDKEVSRGDRPRGRILHVGRFAPGGHCKRQDVMIDVFKRLLSGYGDGLELNLAGSLGGSSEDRDYLLSLQDAARGFPIQFHVNISARKLKSLYSRCSIYWHITGIWNNELLEPEKFEHFGITIAEAMSAGLVAVVLRFGGPPEIIADGSNGFLVSGADELEKNTRRILSLGWDEFLAVSSAASARSEYFSFQNFQSRLLLAVGNS